MADGVIGAGLATDGRAAVLDAAGVVTTYAGVDRIATEVGRAVASAVDGGAARDVALLGGMTTTTLAAFAGLARTGWAVGVLDPDWAAPERDGAIAQLNPAAIVIDRSLGVTEAPAGWHEVAATDAGLRVLVPEGGAAGGGEARAARPGEVFYVGFTSGSSGRPKAFARSHASWVESFAGLDAVAPVAEGATVLVPGPLSSSHFLFGAVHALHVGACVELRGGPIAEGGGLAERLAREPAPDAMYVVPTMLARLVAGGEPVTRAVTAYCAGAALSEDLRASLAQRHPGIRIVEYYGASELSFVAIRIPGDGSPPGSVGRAFPGVGIAIRDERGGPVATGVAGSIVVRSALVFEGYRGEVPASAATCRDGWWTVGDRGLVDHEGHLFVSGRGSSLIIHGGVNVQPEEVEGVLAAAAGVRDCAVVGAPHATWGQEVVAVLLLDDPSPRRSDLRGVVARSLGRAKRPRRYLVTRDPLPLGRTGKVDRDAVTELVVAGRLEELR